MKSMLRASGLALTLALAAGAAPAFAQDHGGRFRERGAEPSAPPQQQAPRQFEARPAPPPRQIESPRQVQAAQAPQQRGNWQGRGPDQRGWQQGQGRFDRGERAEQLRGRMQAEGRERDRVQWQGERRGPGQPGTPQGYGQYRDQQARAQRDGDGRPDRSQYERSRSDRSQYDRSQYDRSQYDRSRFDRSRDGRPDQFRGDQARRDDRFGGQRDWNRGWHRDSRYDWNAYRYRNRDAFRLGGYYAPYRGYSYRRIGIGFSLQPLFFGSSYWIGDPYEYRLPPAYGPYRWVRYYDDALLVNIYTGEVVDTVYDIFW